MPVHTYECRCCGTFEVEKPIRQRVAGVVSCPTCGVDSPWRPPKNTSFRMETGGTGAGRGGRR